MEIEIGKEYITASGDIVKITKKDDDEVYPYDCNMKHSYTKDGNIYQYRKTKDDLICEVVPSIYALYKGGIIDLSALVLEHIEYYTK